MPVLMNHANDNYPTERVCLGCHLVKPMDEFYRHPMGQFGRNSKCKECKREYERTRRKDPVAGDQIRLRDRMRRNTPEARAKRREKMAVERRTNVNLRIDKVARGILARALLAAGKSKTGSCYATLGYTALDLRKRIECQFEPGMEWENHGEWHVDHKKPITAFISQGVTDPRTINMLCNLQPLWAADNQRKNRFWTPISAANDNHTEETLRATRQ